MVFAYLFALCPMLSALCYDLNDFYDFYGFHVFDYALCCKTISTTFTTSTIFRVLFRAFIHS
jgi:hypothetical protein